MLSLLGGAIVPCALVSLGLFLAQLQPAPRSGALPAVALKLLTWVIAFMLLDLPPLWAHAAMHLSALPIGTDHSHSPSTISEAALVSRTILLSTLGSLVSLSLLLVLLGH